MVVVADDTLIAMPAAGVLQSATERCVMLVTGAEPPEVWNDRVKFAGTVIELPGESTPDIGIGAHYAGAATRLLGVVKRDHLASTIEQELAPLGAALVDENLRRALAAYDTLAPHAGVVHQGETLPAASYTPPQ